MYILKHNETRPPTRPHTTTTTTPHDPFADQFVLTDDSDEEDTMMTDVDGHNA